MVNKFDGRFKTVIAMGSDHAGINRELDRLESAMYRTLAQLRDARQVRAWLHFMRSASAGWFTAYKAREGLK